MAETRGIHLRNVFGGSQNDAARVVPANGKTLADIEREGETVRRNGKLGRSTLRKFSVALCKDMDHDAESSIIVGPPKTLDRIVQKAIARYGGDVKQVKDVVRDEIGLDAPAQVAHAKAALGSAAFRKAQEDKGVRIVSVEDFVGTPKPSGWRGLVVHVDIDIGKGRRVNGEVQIVPKDMRDAYKVTHGYLENIRNTEDVARAMGRPLTDSEITQAERYKVMARREHNKAFSTSSFRVLDRSGMDAGVGQEFKIA